MRKLFRFKMRSLLLAVTGFSVWLGVHVHQSRLQQESVKLIQEHGGWVRYDYQLPNGHSDPNAVSAVPNWLRRSLGNDFFHSVELVGFYTEANHSTSLLPLHLLLPGVPKTKHLSFKGNLAAVNDSSIEAVAELRDLESLAIESGENITNQGVAHLERLRRLEVLALIGSQITDPSLLTISKLPRLTSLNLTASGISNDGVKRLSNNKQLTTLFLLGESESPNRIDDDGIMSLTANSKLRFLGISNTQVTTDGVARFAALCPNCTVQK